MKQFSLFLAAWWMMNPAWCPAADLAKTDRSLRKEPAYAPKAPRYCLLVFGPEARAKVWLVLDGRTLLVDRNGSGDLTEPDKARQPSNQSDQLYEYQPVDVQVQGSKYSVQFLLYRNRSEKNAPDQPLITVKDGERTYGAWGDETSPVHLAPRPQDATIIHFGGPLQMGFEVQQPLVKKTKDTYELMVGVGTKGLGQGSFAHLKYWNDAIPEKARPTVVLEFPGKGTGSSPIKVETVLKERC